MSEALKQARKQARKQAVFDWMQQHDVKWFGIAAPNVARSMGLPARAVLQAMRELEAEGKLWFDGGSLWILVHEHRLDEFRERDKDNGW